MALMSGVYLKDLIVLLDRREIDRLGEAQQTERDRTTHDEPHCAHRRVRIRVDVVPELGEWQGSITGERESLSTRREEQRGSHRQF